MVKRCCICGGKRFTPVYRGKIRSGGVGSKFVDGYKVFECKKCSVNILDPFPKNLKDFFESTEYRKQYDYTIDNKILAEKYAYEQNDRLQKVGTENIIDKVVADYGCGTGLFLDLIKTIAKKTIAIEPMATFERIIKRNGHIHYKYANEVEEHNIDVAVTFELIEHLADPVAFLKAVRKNLRDNGILYISVPNNDEILMHANRKVFQKFFYCKSHLMYYGIHAMSYLLERCGFTVEEKSGMHKYDFSNFVNWLKFNKPTGRDKLEYVDSAFENSFKNSLTRLFLSSHIFVKARKK